MDEALCTRKPDLKYMMALQSLLKNVSMQTFMKVLNAEPIDVVCMYIHVSVFRDMTPISHKNKIEGNNIDYLITVTPIKGAIIY